MLAVMEYDGQRGERFVRTAKTRQRERDALRKRDASLKNWRSKESRSPVHAIGPAEHSGTRLCTLCRGLLLQFRLLLCTCSKKGPLRARIAQVPQCLTQPSLPFSAHGSTVATIPSPCCRTGTQKLHRPEPKGPKDRPRGNIDSSEPRPRDIPQRGGRAGWRSGLSGVSSSSAICTKAEAASSSP
jgi:hypothetical protein